MQKLLCCLAAATLSACSSAGSFPDAGCGGALASCGLNAPCCAGLTCSPSLNACVNPGGATASGAATTTSTSSTAASVTGGGPGGSGPGTGGTSSNSNTNTNTNTGTATGNSVAASTGATNTSTAGQTTGSFGTHTSGGLVGGATTGGLIGGQSTTGGLIGGVSPLGGTGSLGSLGGLGGSTAIGGLSTTGLIGGLLGGLGGTSAIGGLGGTTAIGGLSGGSTGGSTGVACANSAACVDPTTACIGGTCQTNYCGTPGSLPDGGQNGDYNETCYTGEAPQGTCAPTSADTGLCIQNGPQTGACNYNTRDGECEPGTLCIVDSTQLPDGGTCAALCDPAAPSCPSQTYCLSFGDGNPEGGFCANQASCEQQYVLTSCTSSAACSCGLACVDAGTLGAYCETPCTGTSECLNPTTHCAGGSGSSTCAPVPCTAGAVGSKCDFTSAGSQDGTCVDDANGTFFCYQNDGLDAGCSGSTRAGQLCVAGLACSLDDDTCEAVCDATTSTCTDGISICTVDTGTDYGVCEPEL